LLCTYNGSPFLGEQLDSIDRQTYAGWRLVISDDGSTDGTLKIAKEFMDGHPDRVCIIEGPDKGFAGNFLAVAAKPPFRAEYWAFCDQDDIWEPDKLSKAVQMLAKVLPEVPALYCSRTLLIDARGKKLGSSPIFTLVPSFHNALVQNIASGNTMVFNEAARRLLAEASEGEVFFHDWLLYLVVTGCGGKVFYDREHTVRYRQHGSNILGGGGSIKGYLLRADILFRGIFKSWIDGNLKAMMRIQSRLPQSHLQLLAAFSDMRNQGLVERFLALKRLRVAHQSPLVILVAALCNKL
jgi:glycosyltransferase involved in cell wall biosynthesis